MTSRQHYKLRGAREEERIGRGQKRIGAHLGQFCKSRVDVANGAGIEDVDLLPDTACGGLGNQRLAHEKDFSPVACLARQSSVIPQQLPGLDSEGFPIRAMLSMDIFRSDL